MYGRFEVIEKRGRADVAFVYLLRSRSEKDVFIECVESLDPPQPFADKWVITLSSQKGCPCRCSFCDAAFYFRGNLSKEELFDQLEIITRGHESDGYLASKKIKLHLARMGEPSLNHDVIEFLSELRPRYPGVNFVPTIATVAPRGREKWFAKLKEVKDRHFKGGAFQLQLSLNTTDDMFRQRIMPSSTLFLDELDELGCSWFEPGDRKVTLNFALSGNAPFRAAKLINIFDPRKYLVKITPLNPTLNRDRASLSTKLGYDGVIERELMDEIAALEEAAFKVIISIGSEEEIRIRSNCGQLAFAEMMKRKDMSRPGIGAKMEEKARIEFD